MSSVLHQSFHGISFLIFLRHGVFFFIPRFTSSLFYPHRSVSMLEILQMPSIDATQTAFADKGVFVSERTVYKWKTMLNKISSTTETTPLISLQILSNEIEAHRAGKHQDDSSSTTSEENTPYYRAKWQKWKSALSSMCSSFRLKKNTQLPPTV